MKRILSVLMVVVAILSLLTIATNAVEENAVVFNDKGIKITYKGLNTKGLGVEWGKIYVLLEIENNSSVPVCVQGRDTSVNGYMIEGLMSEDIEIGKKCNAKISFSNFDFEDNGITSIDNIEFSVIVMHKNSFSNIIAKTRPIKVNSNGVIDQTSNNQPEIKVFIDDNIIAFDVLPTIINGRTMVPLRAIFENLGASVDWNDSTQTVTSTKDNTQISLTINNNIMYVNDVAKNLDVPATLIGGRTLVPVRAISEAFGCQVDWNADMQSVLIKSKKAINKVIHNQNNIIIKLLDYEMTDYGDLRLNFFAENNSTQDIMIFPSPYPSVNGYQVNGIIADSVKAGKKAKVNMNIHKYELEKYGITVIEEIEFEIYYKFDGKVFSSGMLKIAPNASSNFETKDVETRDKAFESTKKHIIEYGAKNDKSPSNIIYSIEKHYNNGILKAMYREKTNDLRFSFEVANTKYEKASQLTPYVILTFSETSNVAELSAIIYYDMGIDHWSPKKEYNKEFFRKTTSFSLDNTTGYGIVEIPKAKKSEVDDFITQSTHLLFESLNSFLGQNSVTLKDLGFINY